VFPVQLCLIAALSGALKASPPVKPDPRISYTLTIDTADLSGIDILMRIENAPSTIRLAMAVHPEYNDRFWRYIRNLRAEADGKPAAIAAENDHSWRIETPRGSATVRYRIQVPREDSANRPVWHTALRRDGASINSTDTFIYLPDYPRAPVNVTLNIPKNWDIASGLQGALTNGFATAGNQYRLGGESTQLLDSPILLGALRNWTFAIDGVQHRVAYWPLPNAASFDTAAFVNAIERFARQAFALFGKAPYARYTFLFADGAWGGLEHGASVTIGARSRDLAKDPLSEMDEIGHEYFHTWNLVALNPRGVLLATANPPTHTSELWWSEGVTLYYAETLRRRAGIAERGVTRLHDLEEELDRFYGDSANLYVSPERGSWTSIDPPDLNSGDYLSNYYTQGRLIAHALDILIRDSTTGRRGIDDVMRLMYDRYAKKSAFTGTDIEQAASTVCQCDMHSFFEDHVRGAKAIDFNPLLAPLGLRVVLASAPVADTAGTRYPDLRISAYAPPSGGRMRVRIMDPRTVWRGAGIHTGMEWVSLNRVAIDSFPDFRRAIRSIRLGDVVPVEIVRQGATQRFTVRVTGYERTRARVIEIPSATPAQLKRRSLWLQAQEAGGAQAQL
jgi:predicted metalloprotease with PDZ domain